MAWPKGKPRNAIAQEQAPEAGIISLVSANADARKTALALAAKRDACIAEMLKPYIEAYGTDRVPQIRRFLSDMVDGKPTMGQKPKPLRMLPEGLRKKEAV